MVANNANRIQSQIVACYCHIGIVYETVQLSMVFSLVKYFCESNLICCNNIQLG